MFLKKANMTFNLVDLQPLNKPVFCNCQDFILDQDIGVDESVVADTIVKIAQMSKDAKEAKKEIDGDATYFDLEAEIKSHPDSLFVKCFAIKADEMNDNGDYFELEELKKATASFVGVPVFTNHQNNDVNQSRGKVIHSWWDPDKNGIMIVARIDAAAYPQLARGIKESYIVGTSMGCQVHHSLCSICHNYAETPDEYCEHIRERKTRLISARNQKCRYHKFGSEEKCPLCGCKEGETKTFVIEKKAFEFNYGIKFIENSFVVNPACHSCGVTEIIDPQKFLQKVTSIQEILPSLLKVAETKLQICDDKQCVKIAGKKELDSLTQALDLISSVSQSMLKQKAQIDLEFCSDLVKVLSDLQTVTDELTQQGYGSLQSPPDANEPESQTTQPTPPAQATTPVQTGTPPATKQLGGPGGDIAKITGPLATSRFIDIFKKAKEVIRPKKSIIQVKPRISTSMPPLHPTPKMIKREAQQTTDIIDPMSLLRDLVKEVKEIKEKILTV